MTRDYHALLAGPRGRRLCYSVALAVEGRVRSRSGFGEDEPGPLANADFLLNVGRPGVTYFGFGTGATPPHTPTTPQELVHALAAVPLGNVSEQLLIDALSAVVDSAKYWQEPDAQDEVLAAPRFTSLLEPWARMITDHPATGWWTSPVALDQAVVLPPGSQGPSLRANLERWLADALDSEHANQRALRRPPNPRIGGTWWSTPACVPTTTRFWPRGRIVEHWINATDMRRDEVTDPVGVLLTEDRTWDDLQEPSARWARVRAPGRTADTSGTTMPSILEIDSAQAWVELCCQFPFDVSASRWDVWFSATGRAGAWVIPNWAEVARHWDGVHLTVWAYLETAGRVLPLDGVAQAVPHERTLATLLAGFSPDETVWLRDLDVV